MIDRKMIDRRITDGQALRKTKLILRVAANMVEHSRTGRALLAGMRATARSFGLVLHQLWLEVTGFTFLALAGIGHAAGPGRLLLAVCFTVSFTWFGLSSFWRVKRKVKS
jgi:hypothetical protein